MPFDETIPAEEQARREIAKQQARFLASLERSGAQHSVQTLTAVWKAEPRLYDFSLPSEVKPEPAASTLATSAAQVDKPIGQANTMQPSKAVLPFRQQLPDSLVGSKRAREDGALSTGQGNTNLTLQVDARPVFLTRFSVTEKAAVAATVSPATRSEGSVDATLPQVSSARTLFKLSYLKPTASGTVAPALASANGGMALTGSSVSGTHFPAAQIPPVVAQAIVPTSAESTPESAAWLLVAFQVWRVFVVTSILYYYTSNTSRPRCLFYPCRLATRKALFHSLKISLIFNEVV